MKHALILLTLFVVIPYVNAANDPAVVSDSGDWMGISPNQKHFTSLAVRVVDNMIWRKDIGIGMLEVVEPSTPNGKLTEDPTTAQYGNYICFDIGHRSGARAQWSPDSRYLVITTVSLGGHSPWHYPSYLYCADDRSLRYMDDVIGLVVSQNFTFVGPHTVRMGVGGFGSNGVDFEHPKEIEIDLDQKSHAMRKRNNSTKGSLSG
jgi:hypothetical protein